MKNDYYRNMNLFTRTSNQLMWLLKFTVQDKGTKEYITSKNFIQG